jgi:ABC-2 type transport system ATP-binding protein
MPSTVIEVDGLRKRYGALWAVDGVSFAVAEGEIFGILGRNGAGKTTAIECLQGLRAPDAGLLRVLGRDPLADRASLRPLVGSQLQDAALPERIRVREAIELFADARAVDADELMQTWGLQEHRKLAFASLSGGLRQRLFIALALLNRPQVVFFDELTQGLDPSARREVWDVIRRVRAQGATVVLVTHFMEEAETLCDRLAVFDRGRVIAEGTPAAIVAEHADSAAVTFAPNGDAPTFDRCPGVRLVTFAQGRMRVEGSPSMIPYVCARLVAAGPPRDLRIEQPTLEDAVLALAARRDR